MLVNLGKWYRQWRFGRALRAARRFCRRHGHQIGPLFAGPRYLVTLKPLFDLFQQCPRCGLRAVIVRGVTYRWKAHRDLHNRFQATFKPPSREPGT